MTARQVILLNNSIDPQHRIHPTFSVSYALPARACCRLGFSMITWCCASSTVPRPDLCSDTRLLTMTSTTQQIEQCCSLVTEKKFREMCQNSIITSFSLHCFPLHPTYSMQYNSSHQHNQYTTHDAVPPGFRSLCNTSHADHSTVVHSSEGRPDHPCSSTHSCLHFIYLPAPHGCN